MNGIPLCCSERMREDRERREERGERSEEQSQGRDRERGLGWAISGAVRLVRVPLE